jgi:lipopolysaccharide biosynthesis glycosyltransferase
MTEKMNILLTCDSNYALPLTVCLTSIFENNKDSQIEAYILYSSLTDEQKNKLQRLAEQYRQKINLIPVASHYFSSAPTLRWSKETYYRLLINEYLPKNLNRVLYLDCDTIVNKAINELYILDLKDKCLASIEEKNSQNVRSRLGLNPNGQYFQSGVILFDLDKSRKILSYDQAKDIIIKLAENLQVVDQDIINFLFDGRIMALDSKFNNCQITSHEALNLTPAEKQKIIDETYIFHYAAGKPWNNFYSGDCEDLWYKYLCLSPYQDLYIKKFDRFKYKILRTRLFKIIFYYYIHLTPVINRLALRLFPGKIYAKLKQYYRQNIK